MIFFDNASTTKIDDTIIEKLKNINSEMFFNAGAIYRGGLDVKYMLENMRENIASLLGGSSGNLIFTGSATEANNLALFGTLKKNTRKILISMGEHPSVYNTALEIKNRGFDVEFVNLDKTGKVDIDDFKNKMTTDVDIVSIMHVSNETGAVNDIAELVSIAKSKNPKVIFHCDGVQAFGKIDVDVESLGVDMYTISAHKIHGCKGVGALYFKKNISIKPIVFGGGQESGIRSGTENILGIFTLAESAKIACENLNKNYEYVSMLKKAFLERLEQTNLKYSLHSCNENSPYIVSLSFENCRAETLLNMLSDREIFVGNGSACSASKRGNRVLENMGVHKNEIEGNLRISFSRYNTESEVEELVKNLQIVIEDYINKAR